MFTYSYEVTDFAERVERINNIQKMDKGTKDILFNLIDTYIQN